MKKIVVVIGIGLILSFVINYAYAQEQITLSTYYPAPYGEYRTLSVGDTYTAPDPTATPDTDLIVQGYVGIGTPTPSEALDAEGTVRIADVLEIRHDNSTAAPTPDTNYIRGTTTHLVINANGALYLNYPEGGTGLVRIGETMYVGNNNGNVGIGTASPGNKLEVFDPSTTGAGGITIHRGHYAQLNIISDNYWSGIEIRRDSAGTAGRPHIDFTNDLTSNFGIRVSAPTNDALAVEGGSLNIGTTGTNTGGLLQVGGTTADNCGIFADTSVVNRPAIRATSIGPTSTTSPSPAIYAENTTAWNDTTGGGSIAIDAQAPNGIFGIGVRGAGSANPSAGLRFASGVLGLNHNNYGIGVYGSAYGTGGWGVYGIAGSTTGVNDGVRGESTSPDGRGVVAYASSTTTTGSPSALEARVNAVNGWAGNFHGRIRADVTGGTGHIYTDIAEEINVRDCSDGDVVVIDPDNNVTVTKATKAYDPTVAGIISETPIFHIFDNNIKGESMPLALAGRVRCKVTTENGSIKRGDILVTSSKPGYAMRADLDKVKLGMILGKALEPLEEGEGKIMVLVD